MTRTSAAAELAELAAEFSFEGLTASVDIATSRNVSGAIGHRFD